MVPIVEGNEFVAGLQGKVRLPQLTGLRAFAALLVFLSHSNVERASSLAHGIFQQGYVGVSFFFVLSGFVLAYSYGEAIRSNRMGWREYVALRAARLLPLHILTSLPFVTIMVATGAFDPVKDSIRYAINAALLHSWFPTSSAYFSFNAPSWSLSNEAFFYLVFPVLIVLRAATKARLLVGLLAVVAAFAAGFIFLTDDWTVLGNKSVAHWLFYIFTAFRLVEFLTGLVVFDLWSRGAFSRFRLIPAAYAALLGAMAYAPHVPEEFRLSLFFLPVAALLLVSHLSDKPSVSKRFFSSRMMQHLGEASFAFYLVHQYLIQRLGEVVQDFTDDQLVVAFVTFAAAVLVAGTLHVGFEKPVERRLRGLARARFGGGASSRKQPSLT